MAIGKRVLARRFVRILRCRFQRILDPFWTELRGLGRSGWWSTSTFWDLNVFMKLPALGASAGRNGASGQVNVGQGDQGIRDWQQERCGRCARDLERGTACVRAVALKTETQQAALALHRMRQQLVRFRTMQINGLRGLLTEYGEVMAVGRAALNRATAGVMVRLSGRLPAMLVDTLREQWQRLDVLDEQIAQIERRLSEWIGRLQLCWHARS